MKLLKSERALKRWLIEYGEMYPSTIKEGDYERPLSYPCYGYFVVESFQYEKLAPVYLYPADLEKMLAKINDYIVAGVTK